MFAIDANKLDSSKRSSYQNIAEEVIPMNESIKFKPCVKKMIVSTGLGIVWTLFFFGVIYFLVQTEFLKGLVGGTVAFYVNQYCSLVAIFLIVLGGSENLLSFLFMEYELQNDQVIVKEGIIWKSNRSIPYHKLTDATITQGPIDRLLGFANISLQTAGSSELEATLEGVENFNCLQGKIQKRIQENKAGVSQPVPVSEETELLAGILEVLKSIDRKLGEK